MDYQGAAPDFLKFSLPGQPPLQSSGKHSARPPIAAGETGPSPGADGEGAGAPGSGTMPCRRPAGAPVGACGGGCPVEGVMPGSGEPLKGGATEMSGGMVAARLAGLPHGGDRSSGDFKGSIDPLKTTQEAADVLNVGTAPVKRARAVFTKGTPELAAAVEAGEITVNAASEIDKLPAAHGNPLQLAGCMAHVRRKFFEAKNGERRLRLVPRANPESLPD
jgi:hypothetical protein